MSIEAYYDENGNISCVVFSECDPEPEQTDYAITIKDQTAEPLRLAMWIKNGYKCNSPQALYIAQCILRGETWRPPIHKFSYSENPFCNIITTSEFD